MTDPSTRAVIQWLEQPYDQAFGGETHIRTYGSAPGIEIHNWRAEGWRMYEKLYGRRARVEHCGPGSLRPMLSILCDTQAVPMFGGAGACPRCVDLAYSECDEHRERNERSVNTGRRQVD